MPARQPKGFEKWSRQVGRIVPEVRTQIAAAQAKNASSMVSSMRALVPIRKGALRRSIGWANGLPPQVKATGAFTVKAKDLTQRQSLLNDAGILTTVYAGDDTAYYARWVEYGTKYHPGQAPKIEISKRRDILRGVSRVARQVKGKRGHPATRAQPYFYPVVRAYGPKIRRSNASAANRALKRAAAA